jgi:protein O-GlcNAc transferase
MNGRFFIFFALFLLPVMSLSRSVYSQNEEALRFRSQIETSLKSGEFPKALAESEKYIKKYPADYMAYQFKAHALYELGNYDASLKTAVKALKLYKDDYYSLYLQGRIYIKKGNSPKGILCFKQALALNSDFPELHASLGEAYLKTQEPQKARNEFKCARETAINPEEKLWTYIGQCYMDADLPMDAAGVYKEFLDEHPDNARMHYHMGCAFLKRGEGRAEGAFKKAVLYGPGNATFREAYADALIKAKKVKDALEQYEKAAATGKATYITYYRLGLVYFQKEKSDKAIPCLEKAVQLKPDLVNAHLALSSMYLKNGTYQQCLDHCRVLVKIDRNNDTAYYNMACALAKLGKNRESFDALRRSIELLPDNKKLASQEKLLQSLHGFPEFKKLIK